MTTEPSRLFLATYNWNVAVMELEEAILEEIAAEAVRHGVDSLAFGGKGATLADGTPWQNDYVACLVDEYGDAVPEGIWSSWTKDGGWLNPRMTELRRRRDARQMRQRKAWRRSPRSKAEGLD